MFFYHGVNQLQNNGVKVIKSKIKVMDTKEKHVKENESVRHDNADMIADSLKARGKERKRNGTARVNKLWLWFGVMILIFILLFWLFSMGIFGDLTSYFNG